MIEVLDYLNEREEEFRRHLTITRDLEARVGELRQEGDLFVEVRHVNTLKSGLLIHLYNIVEAVMTRTLETVGQAVLEDSPRRWTEAVLGEWVRAEVWGGGERIGEPALRRLTEVSGTLARGESPPRFSIKGEPGSWDDMAIKKVAKRLGCPLMLKRGISRNAYEKAYRNEATALQFLAQRRNAISHGAITFEEGANDLTLDELEDLAGRILPYLRAVSESYRAFLDGEVHLVGVGAAA